MPSNYTMTSNVLYNELLQNQMCVIGSEGLPSMIALFGMVLMKLFLPATYFHSCFYNILYTIHFLSEFYCTIYINLIYLSNYL